VGEALKRFFFPSFVESAFEKAIRFDRPWTQRLAWKRQWARYLTMILVGYLVLMGFYEWGAYKRAVQWYEIEPPPQGSLQAGKPVPDLDAPYYEWQIVGKPFYDRPAFWSKEACLKQIRADRSDPKLARIGSFVSGRRCIRKGVYDEGNPPEPTSYDDTDQD
jgi:hypothetical protein